MAFPWAAVIPAAIGALGSLFGGGGKEGEDQVQDVRTAEEKKMDELLLKYISGGLNQPHMFAPVDPMAYNAMNMMSQMYGFGPYQYPGWQQGFNPMGGGSMQGMGGIMPGMPTPGGFRGGNVSLPGAMPGPSRGGKRGQPQKQR